MNYNDLLKSYEDAIKKTQIAYLRKTKIMRIFNIYYQNNISR